MSKHKIALRTRLPFSIFFGNLTVAVLRISITTHGKHF